MLHDVQIVVVRTIMMHPSIVDNNRTVVDASGDHNDVEDSFGHIDDEDGEECP